MSYWTSVAPNLARDESLTGVVPPPFFRFPDSKALEGLSRALEGLPQRPAAPLQRFQGHGPLQRLGREEFSTSFGGPGASLFFHGTNGEFMVEKLGKTWENGKFTEKNCDFMRKKTCSLMKTGKMASSLGHFMGM